MSYELKNTQQSSSILGNCEICGKPVVEVWHFTKFKVNIHPILKRELKIQSFDTYGHHRCIVEKK